MNIIPDEYKNDIKTFVREYFKIKKKKKKIALSLFNKIFIPNMPTQTILYSSISWFGGDHYFIHYKQ